MTTAVMDIQSFYHLLDHPTVNVCIGPRGIGKTGLAARVTQDFAENKIRPIWYTTVNIKHLLPKVIKNMNARAPRWIPGTLAVMDDIHLEYHARKFKTDKQILFDQLVSKSRQLDISFFITTQFSGRADINIFRGADNLLIKKPTKKMLKFDRTQMRTFLEDAYKEFQTVLYSERKKWVYVSLKDDTEAMIGPYDLPVWYTEELSKYLKKSRYSKKRKR